jgi:hypothetical protein
MFPRDIVCLRNISVDTLHKGDTEDEDDDDDDDDKAPEWLTTGVTYLIPKSGDSK